MRNMTFSLRVALLTATAVAVAAIGAAALMYFVVQTQLNSQFDNTLVSAADTVRTPPRGGPGRGFPGGPQGTLTGRGDVAAQIINSNTGEVGRSDAQPVVASSTLWPAPLSARSTAPRTDGSSSTKRTCMPRSLGSAR